MKVDKKSLLALCVCGSLMAGFTSAVPALAAEEALPHGTGVSFAAAPGFYLRDMVVTATRTPLEEKKVPMSVSVITQQDIKDLGAYDIRDALRTTAGLDLKKAGMTGNSVSIRGMASKYTLILVDGKRIAGERADATETAYMLSRININDVERIEVIRGNGSALYGSDAMGGVINIITKKSFHENSYLDTHTSSYSMGSNFTYTSGYTGKLRTKVSVGVEKRRNRLDADYPGMKRENMHGPRKFLDLGLDYNIDDAHGVVFDTSFLKENLTANADMGGKMGWDFDNDRKDFSAKYYGEDGKHNYEFLVYSTDFNKATDTAMSMITPMGPMNRLSYKRDEFGFLNFSVKDSINVSDKHLVTIGAEHEISKAKGTSLSDKGDNPYEITIGKKTMKASKKDLATTSAYIEDQWQISDKWLLIPAVRFTHHETFGDKFSPKIGSTYNLSDNTRIKMNYGKGFRTPTVIQLYLSSMGHSFMTGGMIKREANENLSPEESVNYDVAIEMEKGKAFGKVGYFRNNIDNLIRLMKVESTPAMDVYRYENLDENRVSGVEAEFKYDFDKHWSFKTTYNYLDTLDKSTGEQLDGRAKHAGTVQLTYKTGGVNPLTATLWNSWNADYRFSEDEIYDFSTTNLMLNKKVNKYTRLYGGVDNIFDKKFEQDENHSFLYYGRTWRVGMETTF